MSHLLGLYAVSGLPEEEPGDTALVAPIIELTVDQDVYPPLGTIEFDISTLTTDTWRFQVSNNLAFTDLALADMTGSVGTGNPTIDTSTLTSGKHYFRARIERGASTGPWSSIIVHGDTAAPQLTSSAAISVVEGGTLDQVFTSDKPGEVTFQVFGGVDGDKVTFVGNRLRFISSTPPDFEIPSDSGSDNIYNLTVRLTDMANNNTFVPVTVTIVNDPADDPVYTQLTTVTGNSKSAYAVVTGTPALNITGTFGVGAAMLARSKRATNKTKFQFETTLTSAPDGNNRVYIGVDNGTVNLNPYGLPGYSSESGVTMILSDGERIIYCNGLVDNATQGAQNGDVYSVVVDTVAGTIKFYRTRSAVTTQVGSTITLTTPWTDYYAVLGSNGTATQTANFGESAFTRALDSGYGAF